jgi:hypothetical protein
MFNAFKFGKPKTPGYGLSKQYYITVLAAKAHLPSIATVVNPKGESGAISGFGVPLSNTCSKDDLHIPMARGAYAIASLDRKTVLRCLVISKEEAGFDPVAFALSKEAEEIDAELVARIRGTWTLIQLSVESHDPMVAPALAFLVQISQRFGDVTDGAIADPVSRRYCLPASMAGGTDPTRIDAQFHIALRAARDSDWLRPYTLGLQKFALRELEIPDVAPELEPAAQSMLIGIAQRELDGQVLELGDRIGPKSAPFHVAEGGFDRARWEGIPCFELVPPPNRTTNEVLSEWAGANLTQ